MANDVLAVTHRHVIFTIDEGLREIFLLDKYRKKLLKGLMDEAAKILLDFFQKHKVKAGIISTLHTFGSKLEFNPHVHMVVTKEKLLNLIFENSPSFQEYETSISQDFDDFLSATKKE